MDRSQIEAAVQILGTYFCETYAISGIVSAGEAFFAGMFFLNHTFARHRPKNGATATIANAIPKATRICSPLLGSLGHSAES
jgi:hypothetical protein